MIIDAGKFDWKASGRFRNFTEPDPSYHGLSFAEAFGPLPSSSRREPRGSATWAPRSPPFNAFLLLQGAETLHLRLERHSKNALEVANFLEQHPAVEWVNYPGLPSSPYFERSKKYLPDGQSGLLTFGIRGGYEAGKQLINSLKLFSLVANIGDVKSLVIHPASTTHQQLTPEEQRATGVSRRWCGSPSASRTSATSSPISTRLSIWARATHRSSTSLSSPNECLAASGTSPACVRWRIPPPGGVRPSSLGALFAMPVCATPLWRDQPGEG